MARIEVPRNGDKHKAGVLRFTIRLHLYSLGTQTYFRLPPKITRRQATAGNTSAFACYPSYPYQ